MSISDRRMDKVKAVISPPTVFMCVWGGGEGEEGGSRFKPKT